MQLINFNFILCEIIIYYETIIFIPLAQSIEKGGWKAPSPFILNTD